MKSVHSATPPATARLSVVLLVRHGETDAVSTRLCGRLPGVRLSAEGVAQARRLAAKLVTLPIATVYSSPLTRAVETATPIAAALGLPIVIEEALNEVDFGAWTGAPFAALGKVPAWRAYNNARAQARIPQGESPHETQARIVSALHRWHERHPGEVFVAVSHAEVIRYAVLASTRTSIDQWHTITIPTASITTIRISRRRLDLTARPARAASSAPLALG